MHVVFKDCVTNELDHCSICLISITNPDQGYHYKDSVCLRKHAAVLGLRQSLQLPHWQSSLGTAQVKTTLRIVDWPVEAAAA